MRLFLPHKRLPTPFLRPFSSPRRRNIRIIQRIEPAGFQRGCDAVVVARLMSRPESHGGFAVGIHVNLCYGQCTRVLVARIPIVRANGIIIHRVGTFLAVI